MRRLAVAVAAMLMMGTSPLYAQDALFVVTASSVYIHKAPSTGSPVLGKAPRGQSFKVVRELGSWVSVSWPEGDNGVAYLHVTWGTMSRGGVQAPPVSGRPVIAAPAPRSQSSPTTAQAAPAPNPTVLSRPAFSLPSHVIGLGARFDPKTMGIGGTGRAWAHRSFAVQIEAGKVNYTSTVAAGQMRSMQLAPSLILSPSNLVTNAIWARPYIGGGVDMYRLTLSSTTGAPGVSDNGFGSHIVGGAEFTVSRVPQLGVSADLRRQWVPTVFDGFELDGFGFSMSAHWYVK